MARSATSQMLGLKTFILMLVLIVAAVAIGFAASEDQPSLQAKSENNPSAWIARQAPSFSLEDVNGNHFVLRDYLRSSNVLLFFNEGLSCAPCLHQIVDLNNDYAKFKSLNVTIVSITTDSTSNLALWAQNNKIDHVIVLADESLSVDKLYNTLGTNVSMMPGTKGGHTFVLANSSGVIEWRADYGPGMMYVPDSLIYSNVARALSD